MFWSAIVVAFKCIKMMFFFKKIIFKINDQNYSEHIKKIIFLK